jgi:formate dehydrogenase subunit delta
MDIDNLIHMANRIGQFFEAFPDKAEARDGIALHIAKFWEPRMREELLARIDADGAPALLPLVKDAVLQHRQEMRRKASPSVAA